TYVALCLSGCAGIAVLGARRPGAGPWNFVLIGLLAVLLLPIAESLLTGREPQLGGVRLLFLSATLAVGILTHRPTGLALAALLLAAADAAEIVPLVCDREGPGWSLLVGHLSLALCPWVAFAQIIWPRPVASEFDRLWLDFRDRFGLVWGL